MLARGPEDRIDPPKWQDVGTILVEHAGKFPPALQPQLPLLAGISLRLRRDREVAFYGEVDLIPKQVFGREAAVQAIDDASRILTALRHFPLDRTDTRSE